MIEISKPNEKDEGREGEAAKMTNVQKEGVKQTARKLYQDKRISLETAVWAMKNAGYSREETAEWLELESRPMERTGGRD
jgi:hypothetical protein